MVRLPALIALALTLVATAGSADAAAKRASTTPWATVNVCDTAAHPNAIGVRASIPGAQRKSVRAFVRFRIQWHDPTDGLWHNLLKGGDSQYIALGRIAPAAARQSGQVFRYKAPTAGTKLLLRGRVDVQWRIGKRVVHRATTLTAKGHKSAAGSDPKGYSAATCTLR